MENLFLSTVLELYKENKWEDILKLNEYCLVDGITSIGCGCGLLEWIINKSTGFNVVGYEINKEWWESKYSNPHFIKLNYCKAPLEVNALNSDYALLFCYFNNGPAFHEYINIYKGNVVFIIGPGKEKGRHTDPEPFKANFGDVKWRLYAYQEIKDSKDFIAVYTKQNM